MSMKYDVWYQDHLPGCQKNVDGSSGMMEIEGAKVMGSRSVELKKITLPVF